MASKRASLKGLGAKLFEPGTERTSMPARRPTGTPAHQQQSKYPKATFYLSSSLQGRLERLWLDERRRNPEAKKSKSDLVSEALEAFLTQKEKK